MSHRVDPRDLGPTAYLNADTCRRYKQTDSRLVQSLDLPTGLVKWRFVVLPVLAVRLTTSILTFVGILPSIPFRVLPGCFGNKPVLLAGYRRVSNIEEAGGEPNEPPVGGSAGSSPKYGVDIGVPTREVVGYGGVVTVSDD